MANQSRLQDAARQLMPFQQGRFDNLCGIYSVLNAIRLTQWPTLEHNAYRSRRLFAHAIAALHSQGVLHEVVQHGMDEATWSWVIELVLTQASRMSGTTLRRVPILEKIKRKDIDGALARIERHTRRGEPVLVELAGSYQHYTTIVGIKDNRVLLFDSYGYHWIATASCELDHPRAEARHQIVRAGVAAVRRIR